MTSVTPMNSAAFPGYYEPQQPMHPTAYGGECLCASCQYYKTYGVPAEAQASYPMNMNAYPSYSYPLDSSSSTLTSPTTPMAYDPAAQSFGSVAAVSDPDAMVNPVTYSLMEQFRQTIGLLVAASCSPRGRSLLQSVMRLQHLDKIQIIFNELIMAVDMVMLDQNGCHVMRALIEMLDESQVHHLVSVMSEQLILKLATETQYTRRILQTLFERHNHCNLHSIVAVLGKNARYLAATQQGCIALMRVFEHCTPAQKPEMLVTLLPVLCELACDPFGNYVVQCILEHSDKTLASNYVASAFGGRFMKLSTNKFASNVMEKVVRLAMSNVRRMLMDELVQTPANLQLLVQDGFGNFVVQALIETSTNPAEFKRISERLRPLLHTSPYGHKIEGKLRGKRFAQAGPAQQSIVTVPPTVIGAPATTLSPTANAFASHNIVTGARTMQQVEDAVLAVHSR